MSHLCKAAVTFNKGEFGHTFKYKMAHFCLTMSHLCFKIINGLNEGSYPSMSHKKTCKSCHTTFVGRRDAITCSATCRKRLQRVRWSLERELSLSVAVPVTAIAGGMQMPATPSTFSGGSLWTEPLKPIALSLFKPKNLHLAGAGLKLVLTFVVGFGLTSGVIYGVKQSDKQLQTQQVATTQSLKDLQAKYDTKAQQQLATAVEELKSTAATANLASANEATAESAQANVGSLSSNQLSGLGEGLSTAETGSLLRTIINNWLWIIFTPVLLLILTVIGLRRRSRQM